MAADLPPATSLDSLRKHAKRWLKALRAGALDARERFDRAHPKPPADPGLRDVQHALAREMGFASWTRLRAAVVGRAPTGAGEISPLTSILAAAGDRPSSKPPEESIWREAERALLAGDVVALDRLVKRHDALFRKGRPPESTPGGLAPDYSAMDAREIIVRNHQFQSWSAYAGFAAEAANSMSLAGRFEEAADAIVAGDVAKLEWLLRGHPALIRARSARVHHAMLIHYVGPNGIEYFRQITPANAPDVARVLIAAGADLNATANVYGGDATVLELAATSITPAVAGVVAPLLQALIDGGATIGPDGGALVNSCLRNGRDQAASFLASRGAEVDLEAAAGIGRLDLVRACFDDEGGLKPPSTADQMKDAFAWACEFGHAEVVRFLIDKGMDLRAALKHHGQTGLHWASGGGHIETVRILLQHAAPVEARDQEWHATPLEWALYGWQHRRTLAAASERYYTVVGLLVAAGAVVKSDWFDDEAVRDDAAMRAALRGR